MSDAVVGAPKRNVPTGRSPVFKYAIGAVAIVIWGLFFEDLARSGRWVLDTSYVNLYPLADLHSRYVDAHLFIHHATVFYAFRRGAFTYPPFTALAFLPFHLIGYRATMTVWTVASMVALALILAISLHRWLGVHRADAWLAAAAGLAPACVFLFYPLRSLIVWGQMGVLLTALVFLDLFVMPKRWRGLLIGIATAIKLLPALFIVWFLVRRDVASAVRLVVAFLVLTLFAAAWWPHASVEYWFHILPSGRDVQMASDPTGILVTASRWIYGVGKLPNQSLRGVFGRPPFLWLGDMPWLPVAFATLVGGVVVSVKLLRQNRELAAFMALSVTTVLVSPVSWLHYWSFVALAPLLAIVEWRRDRALSIVAIALAISTCANLENTQNLLFAPFTRIDPVVLFTVRNLYVLGGIAFLVVAAFRAFRASAPHGAVDDRWPTDLVLTDPTP